MNIDTKQIALELVYPREGWVTVERKCAVCKGYKTVSARIECEDTMIYCPTCHGSGTMPVECRVNVEYSMTEDTLIDRLALRYRIERMLARFAAGEDVAGIEIKGER